MGSEPTIGSFDRTGQLRTRDDVVRDAVQGMRDEQLRTGKQIVASIDSANAALASGLGEQTRMLGALGDNLRGVGDEVLHLRYSLERGMDALHSQARLQSELLAVIARATLAPSRTKAQEFEQRAFSLMQRGLLAEARAEANRSLEEEPYQWGAHHLLAQVSEAEGAPAEAVEHYKLAVRYATGVSPRQHALSLTALARMSLEAGSTADAEAFAWEAYRANPTAELLYASAVYLAAAEEPEGDAGVQDRLYNAVIEHPGLAVVAMAEPRLVKRERARDAALTRVRDAMAAHLDVALTRFDEMIPSLDEFLRHHQSVDQDGIRSFVRARVAESIGEQQTRAWWEREITNDLGTMLNGRTRAIGQTATDTLSRMREARQAIAQARAENTIESLHAGLTMLPSLIDKTVADLTALLTASERATTTMTQMAANAEHYVAVNRSSVGKWSTPTDETIAFNRNKAVAATAHVAVRYVEPIREYYDGMVRFVQAARIEIVDRH